MPQEPRSILAKKVNIKQSIYNRGLYMKNKLAMIIEWLRPCGIVFGFFLAEFYSTDAVSKFHILGPFITLIMCGTVGLESLFLGEAASAKIGYAPNRAYQVQSGLSNLAMAVTAVIVYVLSWGKFADAAITTVMLVFFTFSATNHAITIIKNKNMKATNIMRPILTILLLIWLLPIMIKAIGG
jgi:hypothetical protein